MRDQRMIEVRPSPEYSEGNPYKAQIASEIGNEEGGRIRIEPPCTLSEEYLEGLSQDIGMEITHHLTGREASIFRFGATKDPSTFGLDYEEGIVYTVQTILDDLGCVASKSLFESHYPINEG